MPSTANNPAADTAPKGLRSWIEVFRAGTHVDKEGKEISFSAADLDQMVSNVSLGRPPAVIGHPKHNDPAYGWAELKRDGESLFARFDDLHPAFEAGVESGAYRNRSLSVFKDAQHGWRVKHVGWLGAQPPAIDGLKPVEFSAGATDCFEFSAMDDCCQVMAWGLSDVATVLRGLRDWVISRDGLETADRVLPDWSISSITSAATRLREQPPEAAFSSSQEGALSLTQADLDRAVQETEARVRSELSAEFSKRDAQLTALQTERQNERIAAQIAGWKARGLVLPADEPGLTEFMRALEAGTAAEFEFSRAEGATPLKKSPATWFAEFMSARKPVVKIGAQGDDAGAGAEVDVSDYRSLVDAAREYQFSQKQKGIEVSDEAAVAHVKQQGAR